MNFPPLLIFPPRLVCPSISLALQCGSRRCSSKHSAKPSFINTSLLGFALNRWTRYWQPCPCTILNGVAPVFQLILVLYNKFKQSNIVSHVLGFSQKNFEKHQLPFAYATPYFRCRSGYWKKSYINDRQIQNISWIIFSPKTFSCFFHKSLGTTSFRDQFSTISRALSADSVDTTKNTIAYTIAQFCLPSILLAWLHWNFISTSVPSRSSDIRTSSVFYPASSQL